MAEEAEIDSAEASAFLESRVDGFRGAGAGALRVLQKKEKKKISTCTERNNKIKTIIKVITATMRE